MQAVILAGGKGTRLGNLTIEIPKPMIPIDDKPILEHQLILLKKYGIRKVLLTVGHLYKKIQNFVKDGSKWGLEVTYFIEETPLGTAGSFPLFSDQLEEQFFVLYGDVMMDLDIDRLVRFHKQKGADATLVAHPNDHPYDSDLIETDHQGRIKQFIPKPHPPNDYQNLVNAGLYLFNKTILEEIENRKYDFGKDVFPSLVDMHKLYAYNTSEYLKDMGTPDRLEKVTEDYRSGKIARRNLSHSQKAIFLDRDGVLNEDRHLIHKKEDFVLYPFASEAIKTINNTDYIAIVATNQSVVARNLCTIEELEDIHRKLDTDLGREQAKLDALYYCPYHPDKGYPEENPAYKKEHPWRKPNPGMLLQASEDFNIDLSKSYMIGDRTSDIEAGQKAGCTTIGVRTGHGLKTGHIKPDYIFDNALEAVQFITNDPLSGYFNRVYQAFHSSDKNPFIIVISGFSQAGKSTLSRYLIKQFNDLGVSSLYLELDHWLLEKEERSTAKNVLDRYQVAKIEEDLRRLMEGTELTLNAYSKKPEDTRSQLLYKLEQEQVIIVDGIVGLSIPFLRNNSHYSFFLNLNEHSYQQNFRKLYGWKGYKENEIEQLLAKRMTDEYQIIQSTATFANQIITRI